MSRWNTSRATHETSDSDEEPISKRTRPRSKKSKKDGYQSDAVDKRWKENDGLTRQDQVDADIEHMVHVMDHDNTNAVVKRSMKGGCINGHLIKSDDELIGFTPLYNILSYAVRLYVGEDPDTRFAIMPAVSEHWRTWVESEVEAHPGGVSVLSIVQLFLRKEGTKGRTGSQVQFAFSPAYKVGDSVFFPPKIVISDKEEVKMQIDKFWILQKTDENRSSLASNIDADSYMYETMDPEQPISKVFMESLPHLRTYLLRDRNTQTTVVRDAMKRKKEDMERGDYTKDEINAVCSPMFHLAKMALHPITFPTKTDRDVGRGSNWVMCKITNSFGASTRARLSGFLGIKGDDETTAMVNFTTKNTIMPDIPRGDTQPDGYATDFDNDCDDDTSMPRMNTKSHNRNKVTMFNPRSEFDRIHDMFKSEVPKEDWPKHDIWSAKEVMAITTTSPDVYDALASCFTHMLGLELQNVEECVQAARVTERYNPFGSTVVPDKSDTPVSDYTLAQIQRLRVACNSIISSKLAEHPFGIQAICSFARNPEMCLMLAKKLASCPLALNITKFIMVQPKKGGNLFLINGIMLSLVMHILEGTLMNARFTGIEGAIGKYSRKLVQADQGVYWGSLDSDSVASALVDPNFLPHGYPRVFTLNWLRRFLMGEHGRAVSVGISSFADVSDPKSITFSSNGFYVQSGDDFDYDAAVFPVDKMAKGDWYRTDNTKHGLIRLIKRDTTSAGVNGFFQLDIFPDCNLFNNKPVMDRDCLLVDTVRTKSYNFTHVELGCGKAMINQVKMEHIRSPAYRQSPYVDWIIDRLDWIHCRLFLNNLRAMMKFITKSGEFSMENLSEMSKSDTFVKHGKKIAGSHDAPYLPVVYSCIAAFFIESKLPTGDSLFPLLGKDGDDIVCMPFGMEPMLARELSEINNRDIARSSAPVGAK